MRRSWNVLKVDKSSRSTQISPHINTIINELLRMHLFIRSINIDERTRDRVRGWPRMTDTRIPDDGRRLMAALRCSTDSPEPESQLSSEPAPGHNRAQEPWYLRMGRAQWLCQHARWGNSQGADEFVFSFVLCKFSLFLLPPAAVPVCNLPRYQGPAKTLKHFRLFNYTASAIQKYGALSLLWRTEN